MTISQASTPPLDGPWSVTSIGATFTNVDLLASGSGDTSPATSRPAYALAGVIADLQTRFNNATNSIVAKNLATVLNQRQKELVTILMNPSYIGGSKDSAQSADTAQGSSARCPAGNQSTNGTPPQTYTGIYQACNIATVTSPALLGTIANLTAQTATVDPSGVTGQTWGNLRTSNVSTLLDGALQQAIQEAMSSGQVSAATILDAMS